MSDFDLSDGVTDDVFAMAEHAEMLALSDEGRVSRARLRRSMREWSVESVARALAVCGRPGAPRGAAGSSADRLGEGAVSVVGSVVTTTTVDGVSADRAVVGYRGLWRCRSKSCPTCGPIQARIAAERIDRLLTPFARAGMPMLFATFTIARRDGEPVQESIDVFQAIWTDFLRRSEAVRREAGCSPLVSSRECPISVDCSGHPHVNMVTAYLAEPEHRGASLADLLTDYWLAAVARHGRHASRSHGVRAQLVGLDDDGTLRGLSAYVTKGDGGSWSLGAELAGDALKLARREAQVGAATYGHLELAELSLRAEDDGDLEFARAARRAIRAYQRAVHGRPAIRVGRALVELSAYVDRTGRPPTPDEMALLRRIPRDKGLRAERQAMLDAVLGPDFDLAAYLAGGRPDPTPGPGGGGGGGGGGSSDGSFEGADVVLGEGADQERLGGGGLFDLGPKAARAVSRLPEGFERLAVDAQHELLAERRRLVQAAVRRYQRGGAPAPDEFTPTDWPAWCRDWLDRADVTGPALLDVHAPVGDRWSADPVAHMLRLIETGEYVVDDRPRPVLDPLDVWLHPAEREMPWASDPDVVALIVTERQRLRSMPGLVAARRDARRAA